MREKEGQAGRTCAFRPRTANRFIDNAALHVNIAKVIPWTAHTGKLCVILLDIQGCGSDFNFLNSNV